MFLFNVRIAVTVVYFSLKVSDPRGSYAGDGIGKRGQGKPYKNLRTNIHKLNTRNH